MARVTLQVLDGMERGRVFPDLTTPFTIGREEDNDVQLNDDRVSRCHAKVQEDAGRMILTDLGSTNGTRVNGHVVHMHVLQPGDLVTLGRCMLLFDIREKAAGRSSSDSTFLGLSEPSKTEPDELDVDFALPLGEAPLVPLFPQALPELPDQLRPLQLAQLTDALANLHSRLGITIQSALELTGKDGSRQLVLNAVAWNQLLQTHAALALYLRALSEPSQP